MNTCIYSTNCEWGEQTNEAIVNGLLADEKSGEKHLQPAGILAFYLTIAWSNEPILSSL